MQFDITKSTLSTIMKNKDRLFAAVAAGSVTLTQKTSRIKLVKYLEEELFTWFKNTRSTNIPISGPVIQEKATKILKV